MKTIFNLLSLPIIAFSFLVPINTSIQSIEHYDKELRENSNNHEMIMYNNADNTAGEYSNVETTLSELPLYDQINIREVTNNFIVHLSEGYVFDDFSAINENIYLTLYDVTDEIVELSTIELERGLDYQIQAPFYDSTFNEGVFFFIHMTYVHTSEFGVELEPFHEYRLGFHINPGDDLQQYSNIIEPETPELLSLNIESTETTMTIDYLISQPEGTNVEYIYNDLYIKVGDDKYELNDEIAGQIIAEDLKPAKEYDVVFGYDATKIITGSLTTSEEQIVNESNFVFSTLVPSDYDLTSTLRYTSILLLILLIIILLLIIVILYWNYQRRKISGMALVVGEDTQAYDPVYQHNYYQQEDESGIPNTTSSNQGDEVYGYFDDVQDQENYRSEEPYGYFDEVQDNEYYQDEEIAGYFDEVYDDYDESGIDDHKEEW